MSTPPLFMCQRCARSLAQSLPRLRPLRPLPPLRLVRTPAGPAASAGPARPYSTNDADVASDERPKTHSNKKEPSAMSRRLEEATEEALLTGGRAGRRAVEEAGFSDELKDRLFNRIADAQFRAEHSRTIAAAGLDPESMEPDGGRGSAGAGTRHQAAAQPWTGDEATADTVLRMLDDARKPLAPSLRGKPKIPNPIVVDLRLRRAPARSPGQRVANARDKATVYAGQKASEKEEIDTGDAGDDSGSGGRRAAFRKELRERFAPGAGVMPNTFTGLAALANERIEDAIARGQFRSIPRGPGVERDARADNPFIDTTEYIMNKMIQRQEIVPPWIEKQQELVGAARVFRAQLRTDWRRHAARTLASRGGSLQEQMARAAQYARAEQAHNPRRLRDVEQIAVPTNRTDDPVMVQQARATAAATMAATTAATTAAAEESDTTPNTSPAAPDIDLTPPLRDPRWEAAERSYLELAVANLNALTRSYNLMAPELARKPYFSLDRELRSCFADVAPTLAETIRERAARPAKPSGDDLGEAMGRRVLERFVGEGGTGAARVYDSKAPNYGLKEMWRDLWKKEV